MDLHESPSPLDPLVHIMYQEPNVIGSLLVLQGSGIRSGNETNAIRGAVQTDA